jgi:hypothetical protein
MFSTIAVGLGVISLAAAHFPPTPYGITEVDSKVQPGVSISFKEVLPHCLDNDDKVSWN